MAYQTPITIREAISNIQKRKYVLPSIQREFVWEPEQIEQLFDSLMREYPISTFLFWQIDRAHIQDFQLYQFIKDYHEKTARHNTRVDLGNHEGVTAILDGQQRLTSLYIGLRGSYAAKMPYYRWDNPSAFPVKKLHLNLLAAPVDSSFAYDFKFLSEEEVSKPAPGKYWFEVSKILDFTDNSKIMKFMMAEKLSNSSYYGEAEGDFALDALSKLYNIIHQKPIISYYEEKSEELDKVLQIFIRVNSGGTKLSYSDLLLSIATAQWGTLDAREVIHGFVDVLNGVGTGFNFNKDFVMKACLVLGDCNDVRFKVDNFKKDIMLSIESQWKGITKALRLAVELISSYGFNRENLSSANAVIPIAYYFYKNDLKENYLQSGAYAQDRKLIIEWLAKTLIKRVFGGHPDSIYPSLRTIIKENLGAFPLAQIADKFKGTEKSIVFTDDDIDSLVDYKYGNPLTYCILTLLYPGLNNQFHYHVDHIHPRKYFTEARLKRLGIRSQEDRGKMLGWYNDLANLQLLQGTVNMEKNGKTLDVFLEEMPTGVRKSFQTSHYFPKGVSTDLAAFPEFFTEREGILRDRLAKVLGVELQESID
jgi:uncharacterized protein with ParB-like and HNH nuclease domain